MKDYPEFRHGIVWITLLAVIFLPFLDSMACDDFAMSSPTSGGGIEIQCNRFSSIAMPLSSEPNTDCQEKEKTGVHFFCPICFTIAGGTCFYNVGILLSVSIFNSQPSRIARIQIDFPIYKPPQNIPAFS